MTASGIQNASKLGRSAAAFVAMGFFLEGETSFVGLTQDCVGVAGREMGGALQGERFFLGVGEYVRIATGELACREANDDVRVRAEGNSSNVFV